MRQAKPVTIPRLTPKQQKQWLNAIERAKERHAKMLADRGGQLWSPSWELLDEARDERTRQLP
jgi:hypothetical protein